MLSKLAFGSVTWKRWSDLAPAERPGAEEFAATFGARSEKRLARFEFGMAGVKCVGVRVLPGEPGEPDPLAAGEDVETAACDGCNRRIDVVSDELRVCRICNEEFCEPCQSSHEWNCDRWE